MNRWIQRLDFVRVMLTVCEGESQSQQTEFSPEIATIPPRVVKYRPGVQAKRQDLHCTNL